MSRVRYVQYGCGHAGPVEWRNFDASPTLRFERLPLVGRLYSRNAARFPGNVEYGDIARGLPLDADSCAGVYCSHVLEHLSLEDFRAALRNTRRILRPGGVFRLVLPDLEYSISRYVGDSSSAAAGEFLRETFLGVERRPRGFSGFVVSWLGNSQHLWMWDYKAIAPELEAAGFAAIRRATLGDSPDPMFALVEDPGRWENCLGVECRRPP
jgi:SAM-dependent methyltransferase